MRKHRNAAEVALRCADCDTLSFHKNANVVWNEEETFFYVLCRCANCGREWMIKGSAKELTGG
jgi:RNase P subunit RPR2